MKKPVLKAIEEKLQKGANFELTRSQYIQLTGADIPQSKSYTKTKSAVAKIAKDYGYSITVIPEQLIFTKI